LAITLPIATFSIMAGPKHLLMLEQFNQNNNMV